MSKTWETIPNAATFEKTVTALKENGIDALIVDTAEQAKQKALELLPAGAEVMDMTSITLEKLGLVKEIHESGKYVSVKKKLFSMDRETQGEEMQKLGAAPQWAIGSVHAVTHDGKVVIASMTGSQLSGYVYGASHVIWIVGGQKIVENTDEGIKRIYEHTLPLESERAHKAYGIPGSSVNKLLIVNKEVQPKRITMILVKEVLGF